ncbi:type I secretion outer membrane protein, TolC family [Rhodovulum sulfidophilum]|uniref:Type I secretion outer membrane protein, TolC family n=1 Tax=Rhodovulum sulfidophilum TaxID=35806 RepID=A0A0D6B1J7_RHOSU|nr:type I secretion outer membrane protein, TolC family [Rhodovulum sulfidophilum]
MSGFLRYFAGTALSATLALGAVGAAQAETLTDALIAAYKNSHLLDQNRALLRAADEDAAQALATLRPVIAFAMTGNYTDPASAANGLENTNALAELTATLTVYDGGQNRMALDATKETVLATRAALIGVEQDVLLSAVQAYMDVFAALQTVSLAQNNNRLIAEELRATEDRFEVGEVTRTDVSLAQSALAEARSNLVAANGQLATARESYKLAVGHYPDTLSGIPNLPSIPTSPEGARSVAVKTHPDIVQAQHNVTVSELNLARSKAAQGPSLTASVGYQRDDNSEEGYQAQLKLSQTIYAGGKLYAAERQAVANMQATRAGLLQTVRLVELDVGNAWSSLAVARAQVSASDQRIRAAQLAFDGTKEEARLGARTTLDVLDAEQDLLDARTARVEAEATQYTAIYSVLASMGLLTAEHLGLGIPTYDPNAYYNAVSSAPPKSLQGGKLDRVLQSIGRN